MRALSGLCKGCQRAFGEFQGNSDNTNKEADETLLTLQKPHTPPEIFLVLLLFQQNPGTKSEVFQKLINWPPSPARSSASPTFYVAN